MVIKASYDRLEGTSCCCASPTVSFTMNSKLRARSSLVSVRCMQSSSQRSRPRRETGFRSLEHWTIADSKRKYIRRIVLCESFSTNRSQIKIEQGRYAVSVEDVAFFHENGYVHLPGVMTEAEMKEIVDPVYYKYLAGQILVPGKDLCDMSGALGRTPDQFTVYNVMLPRIYFPQWQGNLFEERCKGIANQLQGSHMDIDYDQILAKRPHSADSVFAWHQDMAYWPPLTSSTATATCWLAVTNSTLENGCMRFVAGSHKEPNLRKHHPVGKTREESHALYTKVHEGVDTVTYVPIQRGDITVHNERVIHGSGPNNSGGWRNAYVLAFRKESCIAEERSWGFTHSHNDQHSWDAFNRWSV